jgi:hypothetical protein
MFDDLSPGQLAWFPALGWGYYEVEGAPYDQGYFDRYAAQADSRVGRSLMAARVRLVKSWLGDVAFSAAPVLDVGIGSGAFIEAAWGAGCDAVGYDVNPAGVEWLTGRGLFRDLYADGPFQVVTFWDALEHIRDPREALAACSGWVFVSLPIFRDAEHVLRSKHFRRDEHYHYWTRSGFARFADACGFRVLDITATETALGREDIETFVLRRA